jgi:hypothetical protein
MYYVTIYWSIKRGFRLDTKCFYFEVLDGKYYESNAKNTQQSRKGFT